MAETAAPPMTRRSALAALAIAPRADADAGVTLAEIPHTAKLNLRGDPTDRGFMTAVGKALDMVLPTEPNTATASGGVTALWLGPDEWLLTAAPGEESALAAKLREALSGVHAAVIDVTENSTVLRLSGPRAGDVLAKGCPLDLHPSAFAPGRAAQSLIGPVDATIHQTAPGVYEIYVRRSFAEYLWRWLEDAGAEYGVAVAF
ncbi:MAG TPA: sarcosine oxidase subunit gamma family protein [Alphaproteobacteria bacterium]|nr:sarcosine oxidase subunit gamma family protein [Alphaproteobacteria bacterium]